MKWLSNSKMWLSLFFMLVVQVILTSGCETQPKAVADLFTIRGMFEEFKTALQNDDGQTAAVLVSQTSTKRFEQFRKWALSDTAEELRTRTALEQIETLRLRRLFTRTELEQATGRDVIAMLIDRDQLPTPFVEDAVLAEPVFKEKVCFIQIFDQGGAIKEKLVFVEEEDNWLVDLAAMEYVQDSIYQSLMQKNHLDTSGVVQMVVMKWGDDVNIEQLYQPLISAEKA